MPKERRSFFEKLTGSISLGNETEDFNFSTPPVIKDDWSEEEAEVDGELAVDVYERPTEIVVQAMVAGVKPEDLDVNVTREMVTIKGRRESIKEINSENYFQKELYWGSFSRTILLPVEVEAEEAEALEKNGLLTVRIPKIDRGRSSKLKIRTA
ncbi:MAG: Hsp20/alpha crystallin family protein [Candidatus Pacebacteria bacterium]|nr:Hsp20/alpha crystallin family protein [Candidatus Paceibacterota bacterium]